MRDYDPGTNIGCQLAERAKAYADQLTSIYIQGWVEGMLHGSDPRPLCLRCQPGTSKNDGHKCTRPIGHGGRHIWTNISWGDDA